MKLDYLNPPRAVQCNNENPNDNNKKSNLKRGCGRELKLKLETEKMPTIMMQLPHGAPSATTLASPQ